MKTGFPHVGPVGQIINNSLKYFVVTWPVAQRKGQQDTKYMAYVIILGTIIAKRWKEGITFFYIKFC